MLQRQAAPHMQHTLDPRLSRNAPGLRSAVGKSCTAPSRCKHPVADISASFPASMLFLAKAIAAPAAGHGKGPCRRTMVTHKFNRRNSMRGHFSHWVGVPLSVVLAALT